ncbi:hypothetical protein [Pseudoalteromonas sp. R3]|uniref:hypothetical protein n=1 Tax=Pseudoalteromonas sp. R3 TaxID=1709477 RepID=UPI000A470B6C|nr:hypothetical protein [Pseudoalteromonas sp. R3]
MLLKLKKKPMKALSNDKAGVPANMTPQVAGGVEQTYYCWSDHRCPGTQTSWVC